MSSTDLTPATSIAAEKYQQRLEAHLATMHAHVAMSPEERELRLDLAVDDLRTQRRRALWAAPLTFLLVIGGFLVGLLLVLQGNWWALPSVLAAPLGFRYCLQADRLIAETATEAQILAKAREQVGAAAEIDGAQTEALADVVMRYPVIAGVIYQWLRQADGRLSTAELQLIRGAVSLQQQLDNLGRVEVLRLHLAACVATAAGMQEVPERAAAA